MAILFYKDLGITDVYFTKGAVEFFRQVVDGRMAYVGDVRDDYNRREASSSIRYHVYYIYDPPAPAAPKGCPILGRQP